MRLEQQDTHEQQDESIHRLFTKIQSKWIIDQNVKHTIIQLQENNIRKI